MAKHAIVLLSGGLDSATVAAIAKDQGYTIHGLSFSYGQRHSVELNAAGTIAKAQNFATHKVVEIDLRAFGGSALTSDLAVPKHDSVAEIGGGIPITYVPARNTIFLAMALGLAEVTRARDIFIGVNAVDYSGYPDCRPEFITAFETMANLATKAGVENTGRVAIQTPLMNMRKDEIIQAGLGLGVDYGLTISCYDPDSQGAACSHCDSCLLRKQGFKAAGAPDPTVYQ